MNELETKLGTTELRAVEYEKKYEKTIEILSGLKGCIKTILENVGTNNGAADEMIEEQGVTEANMMQCMGLIELRTNEILQMHKRNRPEANLFSLKNVKKPNVENELKINPPDMDRDIEDEEHSVPGIMSLENMRDLAIVKSSGLRRK